MLSPLDNVVGIDFDNASGCSSLIKPALEIFDGSSITDPVVVSGLFWRRFKRVFIFGSCSISKHCGFLTFDSGSIIVFAFSRWVRIYDSFREKDTIVWGEMRKASITTTPKCNKLVLCLFIDVVGCSPELLAFVEELVRFILAPVSALTLKSIFGQSNVVFTVEFVEEFYRSRIFAPSYDLLVRWNICGRFETSQPFADWCIWHRWDWMKIIVDGAIMFYAYIPYCKLVTQIPLVIV